MPKDSGYEGHKKTGVDRKSPNPKLPKGIRTKGRTDGTEGGWSGVKDQLQRVKPAKQSQAGGIGAEPVGGGALSRAGDQTDRIQPVNGAGTNRIGAKEIRQ